MDPNAFFTNFKSKIPSLLGYLVFFFIAAFIWSWINSPMEVVIDGHGEVEVKATSVILSYSMVGRGGDPASAINDVNTKVAISESGLTGVASGDISKSQVQVLPVATGGYQAVVTMAAKTLNVADTPTLISRLYSLGASAVSQPVLSVSKPEQYENQAYDAAVKDAKAKAPRIGFKNFKFIKKITGITQTAASSTSTATKNPNASSNDVNPDLDATGVFKISKTVNVSYKMW